ncbi:hypothetical protein N7444_003554 [Penicillium canescens]|nr:hypothetical protein N7444_003554 [Penicillium canescens]
MAEILFVPFLPKKDVQLGYFIFKDAEPPNNFLDLGLRRDYSVNAFANCKSVYTSSRGVTTTIATERFQEHRLNNHHEFYQKLVEEGRPQGYLVVGYHTARRPKITITNNKGGLVSFTEKEDIIYVYECVRVRNWGVQHLYELFGRQSIFITLGAGGWDEVTTIAHPTHVSAALPEPDRC